MNITANHPVGEADGITSSIDMLAVTPADPATAIGRACVATAAEMDVTARECLVVQLRFSVAADAPRGELIRIRAATADHREVAALYGKWANPGTTDTGFTVLLPNAAEYATVYWSTGSALTGYTEFSGEVPGMILPVDWLGHGAPPPTTAPPESTTP